MGRGGRGGRGGRAHLPVARLRWHLLPLLPLLPPLVLTSCELTEVTVPTAESALVVHAVFVTGMPAQSVIVEESFTGTRPVGGPVEVLPGGTPPFPVSRARVEVVRGGERVVFRETATRRGVYSGAFTPSPGEWIRLEVVTADGRRVTGATTVAGGGAVWQTVRGDSADLSGVRAFNRDRDTIAIGARPEVVRGLQIEVRERFRDPGDGRLRDAGDDGLAIYMFTDTLGVTFAGNLVNPFEGDSGMAVFRAGRTYNLAVAIADTTYYDFVRSGNDPFTGRGFINHLDGALGVFGSVDTRRMVLRVEADVDDPEEGTYRITGALNGDSVDLAVELYLDDIEVGRFSAFLEGTWLGSLLFRDAVGRFTDGLLELVFARGLIAQDTFEGFVLRGRRATAGRPFALEAFGPGGELGSLTAVQVSGPRAADPDVAAPPGRR